jgi:hypothetical protein
VELGLGIRLRLGLLLLLRLGMRLRGWGMIWRRTLGLRLVFRCLLCRLASFRMRRLLSRLLEVRRRVNSWHLAFVTSPELYRRTLELRINPFDYRVPPEVPASRKLSLNGTVELIVGGCPRCYRVESSVPRRAMSFAFQLRPLREDYLERPSQLGKGIL